MRDALPPEVSEDLEVEHLAPLLLVPDLLDEVAAALTALHQQLVQSEIIEMDRVVRVLRQVQIPLEERLMDDALEHFIIGLYVLAPYGQVAGIYTVFQRF